MNLFMYAYLPLHFLAVLLDVFDEQVLPCQLVVVRKVVHHLVLAWEVFRSARAHSLTRTIIMIIMIIIIIIIIIVTTMRIL